VQIDVSYVGAVLGFDGPLFRVPVGGKSVEPALHVYQARVLADLVTNGDPLNLGIVIHRQPRGQILFAQGTQLYPLALKLLIGWHLDTYLLVM
jgi:hypothetical protein